MEKHFFEFSVKTENEAIVIEGPIDPLEDRADSIYLAPEQVDLLIDALKEARSELS
ncbi:MAG: hypothetical protein AAGU26_10415 [bacterium]